MKFFKGTAVLLAGLLALSTFSGCRKKTYAVYANIPREEFELHGDFKLGGLIAGYAPQRRQFEEKDVSSYESMRSIYFEMAADAEVIVADDFTRADAEVKYDAFKTELRRILHDEIDAAISTTASLSDVTAFNNAQAGESLEIRRVTYEVLREALAVYELTDGYYNPALYYNVIAYGFGGAGGYPRSAKELPDDGLIEKYTELASHFGETEIYESGGKYFVTKPAYTVTAGEETLSMKIDLGGIGKGYAVDLVDAVFEKYGYEYGYFNFGSSSMLVKNNVLSGAYNLGFSSPRSPSREAYLTTSVRNEKISTSGDGEKYYKIDGERYCHIIDPTTGKPVRTGIMTVTVIGGGAASADALTTAIMAMGRERAIKFIEEKLTDRKVAFACE